MELLDDVCHIESHFGPFGDIVSFDATLVHSLHLTHQSFKKPFWTHFLVLLGEGAQVDARFGLHGTYQMLANQSGRT